MTPIITTTLITKKVELRNQTEADNAMSLLTKLITFSNTAAIK